MEAPLAGVLSEMDDLLLRNRIPWADVSTVVAVGGGARIPLTAERLSEHTQAPVVTTPQPALDAAVGAALFAAHGAESDARDRGGAGSVDPTHRPGAAPVPRRIVRFGDVPRTGLVAGRRRHATSRCPTPAASTFQNTGTTRAVSQYVQPTGPIGVDERRAWQRLPQLVFGLAAVAALAAVGGVAIALTSTEQDSSPAPSTTQAPPPPPKPSSSIAKPPPPPPPPPPPTTEAPPQNIVTVTSEAPPPPPQTVTVERPAPTTHTTTITTTEPTTTTPPTTTHDHDDHADDHHGDHHHDHATGDDDQLHHGAVRTRADPDSGSVHPDAAVSATPAVPATPGVSTTPAVPPATPVPLLSGFEVAAKPQLRSSEDPTSQATIGR